MNRPYLYFLDPHLVRPNYGGVLSEDDWIAENLVTADELVRFLFDRHTDRPRPDPCALWHAKETS